MSLTWHIVQKDLRRLALPVGAWVAFVGGAALWLSMMHMPEAAVRARDLGSWVWGVGAFAGWTIGMQVITSVLLAGYLVLEDPVVGTTAFWQTRPIGRGRMLAAKLIAGGLLLVVAPVAALVPVWLANGFGAGELALAAAEFAGWQAAIVVVAIGFAALSGSLAQFFFATVGVAVAYVVAVSAPLTVARQSLAGEGVIHSREMIAWLLPAPFMAAVAVFQFGSRLTRVGWVAIAAGLVGAFCVRAAWPFDLTPLVGRSRAGAPVMPLEPGASDAVAVKRIVSPYYRASPNALIMTTGEQPVTGRIFAPESGQMEVRMADSTRVHFGFARSQIWAEDAAKRLAGLAPDKDASEWVMAIGAQALELLRDVPAVAGNVHVQVAQVRGRVVAEVPLRAGASARSGSSAVRIVGIGEGVNYERPSVIVEERDALFLRDVGLTFGRQVRQRDTTRLDVYLLANRQLGVAACLHITELGSTNMASMLVCTRQLEFVSGEKSENGQPGELPAWRDGAVLIKVRFEVERRVMREVSSANVPIVAGEAKK